MCRIGATQYGEVVGSLLFPGNTLSQQTFQDAVWKMEQTLRILPNRRWQTLLRTDGGFGTDDNIRWGLYQGYEMRAKGFSGKRAGSWGKKAQNWLELEPDQRWAALAPEQLAFSRPTRAIAARWRASLLLVLTYPELPLRNNPAELAARYRARKRDISFGPRTEAGKRAWDTFMTLLATTKKLGISFYDYLRDRVTKSNAIPNLAELIQLAAKELNLGWSYASA